MRGGGARSRVYDGRSTEEWLLVGSGLDKARSTTRRNVAHVGRGVHSAVVVPRKTSLPYGVVSRPISWIPLIHRSMSLRGGGVGNVVRFDVQRLCTTDSVRDKSRFHHSHHHSRHHHYYRA